jgi:predicted RecA/RadA family phage recombinase
MDTFVGEAHRLQWTNSTGASVASGDVVVLEDMIGIAVATIANGSHGNIEIDGVHDLDADATTAFKFGDQLWWDPLDLKLFRTPSFMRVPAGMAAEAKAQSTAKCEFLLNINTVGRADLADYVVYFDDFLGSGYALATPPSDWSTIDTSAAGAPTIVQAADNGGSVECKAATNDEAEAIGINKGDKLLFDIDNVIAFVCRFKAPTLAAVDGLVVGMGSAHNNDPDSIAGGAWLHIAGNQNVCCESDDGTIDNDDKDSALDLGNAVFARVLILFANKADIRFYLTVLDGTTALARVQAATTFDAHLYTAGLQPMAFSTKASGAAQNLITVDYIGVIATR